MHNETKLEALAQTIHSGKFPPMVQVLKDPELHALLERDGFVIVDFYSPEEVAELRTIYFSLHQKQAEGFYASTFHPEQEYRLSVDANIRRIGERGISKYFQDIKVMFGSFIVKGPDENSEMCIHQDMTLVDESKYTGINIWAPLEDLNTQNGPLHALRGSHRLIPTLRGATIPGIYVNVKKEAVAYMEPLYLKAGQGVIFDQSIIHYSPPNFSNQERIVVNTFVTHKDAPMRIVYFDNAPGNNKVEVFSQENDFMIKNLNFGYDIFARPSIGESLGFIEFGIPKLKPEDLDRVYGPVTLSEDEGPTPVTLSVDEGPTPVTLSVDEGGDSLPEANPLTAGQLTPSFVSAQDDRKTFLQKILNLFN